MLSVTGYTDKHLVAKFPHDIKIGTFNKTACLLKFEV